MEYLEKEFKEIQNFVDRLKSTNSNNDKIDIIREYKDDKLICEILEYVYSPFKQYYTTSTNLKNLIITFLQKTNYLKYQKREDYLKVHHFPQKESQVLKVHLLLHYADCYRA